MTHKKFFFRILASCLLVLCGKLFLSYLIDPIGIWGAPVVQGLNHYKARQHEYADVWKPYEYIRTKPDILYIGASRTREGFKPNSAIHTEKKVFNMGLSALSLRYMRDYLRFAYKVHTPEMIFMELLPEHFEKWMQYSDRAGYSQERLDQLSGTQMNILNQIVKDSLDLPFDAYWSAMLESQRHIKDGTLFFRGWSTSGESTNTVDKNIYVRPMWWIFMEPEPHEWKYSPEAIKYFQEIVHDAQNERVSLVVFFSPHSVDRYAVIELMGLMPDYQRAKREAAHIFPIYDFAFVNELTTNREAYFLDAMHFRASLGDKLKQCMESGNPEPYGYLLTPETVNAVFAKEDAAWEKWAAENQEYVNALRDCIESGRKLEVGEFEKYIGF